MKKRYEQPCMELDIFKISEDILFDPSRIPDDGEIDDDDIFA